MRGRLKCVMHSFSLNHGFIPLGFPGKVFNKTDYDTKGCRTTMHLIPLRPYSSYMKGFNVITYKVDLVEYMCCSLHSFEFSKDAANLYPKYKTLQCQHFLQTFNNLIYIQHHDDTTYI